MPLGNEKKMLKESGLFSAVTMLLLAQGAGGIGRERGYLFTLLIAITRFKRSKELA
jgi:hypothetical protein